MTVFEVASLVVDLTDVSPGDAYAWGVEAGCFLHYDEEDMLGRHVIFAGNATMVEMIVMEQWPDFAFEVLKQCGNRLVVRIFRR